MQRKGIRTREMLTIAKERIEILFSLAEKKVLNKEFDLAKRYVKLARKIGMRYNVRLPKEYKRKFCKNCNSYFLSSVNCQVRLKKNKVVILCKNCNSYTRFPYFKEKKERRKK